MCETLALLGTNWNNGLKASVMYWNLNNVASNRNYNIGDHFTALYSFDFFLLVFRDLSLNINYCDYTYTLPLCRRTAHLKVWVEHIALLLLREALLVA